MINPLPKQLPFNPNLNEANKVLNAAEPLDAAVTSAVSEDAAVVTPDIHQPSSGESAVIQASIGDTGSTPKRKAGRPRKIPSKRGRYIRKPKG